MSDVITCQLEAQDMVTKRENISLKKWRKERIYFHVFPLCPSTISN